MAHRELTSTVSVMDALGGTQAVADLTGSTYAAAFNWRSFKNFPTNTYLILTTALREAGYSAPDSLWGMKEPRPSEPAQASA